MLYDISAEEMLVFLESDSGKQPFRLIVDKCFELPIYFTKLSVFILLEVVFFYQIP